MKQPVQMEPFELSGGALCLDFTNTLGDRPRSRNETLTSLADLLRWAAQAEILTEPDSARLRREATARPRAARAAYRRAIAKRETLYRIFSSLAAGRQPQGDDLAVLNDAVGRALGHLRIEPADGAFAWNWADPGPGFDHLLWPVVRSAAELLTSAHVARIRECDSETCGWLFIDGSRAGRRRWCDMKTCGNRAKARRHYRRSKEST